MLLDNLTPGATIKFPLSVRMDTVKGDGQEVSRDAGPLALTIVRPPRTVALQVDHVPYTPAGVNYVESGGDVISGIFSGCVMSVYRFNGSRRVAHIHTGDDAGEGLDCKDYMRDLLASSGYTPSFSFKPFDRARDTAKAVKIAMKTAFGAQGCATFGVVTALDKCYSIFTRKVSLHEYVVELVEDRSGSPYVFN